MLKANFGRLACIDRSTMHEFIDIYEVSLQLIGARCNSVVQSCYHRQGEAKKRHNHSTALHSKKKSAAYQNRTHHYVLIYIVEYIWLNWRRASFRCIQVNSPGGGPSSLSARAVLCVDSCSSPSCLAFKADSIFLLAPCPNKWWWLWIYPAAAAACKQLFQWCLCDSDFFLWKSLKEFSWRDSTRSRI